jgi:hypothetical protein
MGISLLLFNGGSLRVANLCPINALRWTRSISPVCFVHGFAMI